MRLLRLAVLSALAVALTGAAHASGPIPLTIKGQAPQGLRAFLLRADEPDPHVFPRTPSFAWIPIRQPGYYQFELATNRNFADASIIFKDYKVTQPAESISLQLPWMTGLPYALWAHVRFVAKGGKYTPWSNAYGFNMRWRDEDVPTQLPGAPGLVRWKPIEGATAYDVLYPDITAARDFETTTNVADEREFFTFHQNLGWGATIHWRVRAVRFIDTTQSLTNGLPRVSYGPWSPIFSSTNPPVSNGVITPTTTASDSLDTAGSVAAPHELTPGFAWNGSPTGVPGIAAGSPLYRVYVFTDDHCVNRVFSGAVVGSPAYAPRTIGGPLELPQTTDDLALWQAGLAKLGGTEGKVYDAAGDEVLTNEVASNAVGSTGTTATTGATATATPGQAKVAGVDLWDSGWPTGRFYWTVVPVSVVPIGKPTKPGDPQPIEYHEVAVPQDACEAGRMMSFGKVTQPVVAQSSTPFISGLSPAGRYTSAVRPRPTFHDSPLIAWQPAVGARQYEVEWTSKLYPWIARGSQKTYATSMVLPVKTPGFWYYRVRGINPALPVGAQNMTWSSPVAIRITGNVFSVVK